MTLKTYFPYYKNNLTVAIPVILSQLGQVVVQMVDTMMVGRLGATELASVSFASAIFNLGLFFSTACAMGLTPLVGQNNSKGNNQQVSVLFQNSFLFNMILGVGVMAIILGVSFFTNNMGQDSGVSMLAAPYLRIVAVSLIPVLVFLSFKQLLEGIGNTSIAMIITIVTNVINIALNYVLIYGKFGAPALGVNGAAYATLISRIMMPIAFLFIFLYTKDLRKYFTLFRRKHFGSIHLKELAKVGLPIGTQVLSEQIAFSLTAIMVGWLGPIALASHQVAMNVSTFVYMIMVGLGAACTIRVSNHYGLLALDKMRKSAYASYHLTFGMAVITATTIIALRHQIPMIFTTDAEVIGLSAQLLIIAALYQIPDGLQVASLGALRGIADVKKPMIYASMAYLGLNIPIGYICGFLLNMGAMGIWVGFIFGLTTAAICFIYRFENKYRILKREKEAELLEE